MLNIFVRLFLKLRFGKRLKLGNNISFSSIPKLIIDKDSTIHIGDNVFIRDLVELRATKAAKLIIDRSVKLDRLVRIIATNNADIRIGENTRIGIGSVFNGGGAISIGKNTLISGYVYLQTSMHNHKGEGNIISDGYVYGDVILNEGCWLGVHSVIFPHVELGERCIVGSNAVVNRSFGIKSVVGGIPAKELNHA